MTYAPLKKPPSPSHPGPRKPATRSPRRAHPDPGRTDAPWSPPSHATVAGDAPAAAGGLDIPHTYVVPPDHASEHQADRLSESVVADSQVPSVSPISEVPPASWPVPESFTFDLRHQLRRPAPGLPVSAALKGELFADLSRARLHQGVEADRLTSRLATTAFTYGRDVFMHRSVRPDTPPGRSILAHEAAHVLQQRNSTAPVIQCSTTFAKKAADSQYKRVGTAPTWAKNDGLLNEFRAGLKKYLALTVKMSPDNLTIESVSDDDKLKQEVVSLIETVFSTPVVMPRAETGGNKPELYESVDSKEALRRWNDVREKITAEISKDVRVFTESGADLGRSQQGKISFDSETVENTVVAAETGWDGFWLITHEMLHNQGMTDSKVGVGRYSAPKGMTRSFEEVYANEKLVNAIVDTGAAKPQRYWSFTGQIESYLNVIRIAFGLPLRTTYADKALGSYFPFDTIVNFSYATAPASKGGMDVRNLNKLARGGVDYPEFSGIRSGPANGFGYRKQRMLPSRGAEEIAADRQASQVAEATKPWITALVSKKHAGHLGRRKASFHFEQSSAGVSLHIVVPPTGKGKAKTYDFECSVRLTNSAGKPIFQNHGVDPAWDGLSIECKQTNGSDVGTLLLDRQDSYYNEVRRLIGGYGVRFKGKIRDKNATFSVMKAD